jgi:hypothetical protein
MGVYHKFSIEDYASTWILLQPLLAAKKIVQSMDNKYFSIPTHVSILRTSLRQWRWYLIDLDDLLRNIVGEKSEVSRLKVL